MSVDTHLSYPIVYGTCMCDASLKLVFVFVLWYVVIESVHEGSSLFWRKDGSLLT